MTRRAVAVILCAWLSFLNSPLSYAKSGGVLVAGNVLLWGQYRVHRNVIGVGIPFSTGIRSAEGSQPAGDVIAIRPQRFPSHGAAVSLVRCQNRGGSLFTKDGAIDAERLQWLRRWLETLMRFDMLPVVVLFDPAVECRLESNEAYQRAARDLLAEILKDDWLLVCVSDKVDSLQWAEGDFRPEPLALVDISCVAARAVDSGQILAAGGTDASVNEALVESHGIGVIVRTSDRFRDDAWKRLRGVPVIDVVPPAALADPDGLSAAVRSVFDTASYGFIIDNTEADEARDGLDGQLELLGGAVKRDQVERVGAVPLDPSDSHSLAPGEREEGFLSLFNGRDLAGWVPITEADDFVVEDQAIVLKKRTGGWLRSWRAYGDFVFRCQYRITQGGNSGIYFRSPLVGRQSRIGFEFQIMGDQDGAEPHAASSGSIYEVRAPDENRFRPEKWNDLEVRCVGESVRIVWNGHLVHDFRYRDLETLRGRSTDGYIGLQDHHNPVAFRKLRIRELPSSTGE